MRCVADPQNPRAVGGQHHRAVHLGQFPEAGRRRFDGQRESAGAQGLDRADPNPGRSAPRYCHAGCAPVRPATTSPGRRWPGQPAAPPRVQWSARSPPRRRCSASLGPTSRPPYVAGCASTVTALGRASPAAAAHPHPPADPAVRRRARIGQARRPGWLARAPAAESAAPNCRDRTRDHIVRQALGGIPPERAQSSCRAGRPRRGAGRGRARCGRLRRGTPRR